MLKLIENSSEAMDFARYLIDRMDLSAYDVGICGAFVLGTNKKNSRIDIVLARKRDAVGVVIDKETPVGLRSVVQEIDFIAGQVYYTRPRVLWYDLLEEENKTLSAGLPSEYPTPFSTLQDSIRWVDENQVQLSGFDSAEDEEEATGSDVSDEAVEAETEVEGSTGVFKEEDTAECGQFEELDSAEQSMIDAMGVSEDD